MSRGLIFWVLMLVWFVFFLASLSGFLPLYAARAGGLLEFILFLLLGWQVYGKPIQS
jgi:hypothetical protein